MNPEKPSREEIELRLTALLLGELPADEAALLRYTISQDAGLQKLHDELASTIILVREVEQPPAETTAEKSASLKLSDERREKLLAHFQTPRPHNPLFWLKRIEVPRLITALACIALVAFVAAMFLPALASAKKKSQKISVANAAKQKALEEQIRLEDEKFADAQPVSSPTVVTVAPEPILAPPHAQIVLPPAETPAESTTTSGSLANSDQTGVISQNIVGYANVQNNSSTVAAFGGTAANANKDWGVSGSVHGLYDGKTPISARQSAGAAGDSLGLNTSGSGQPLMSGGQVFNSGQIADATKSAPRAGGIGGGGGTTPSGSSALAWFDSEANRSKSESAPKNLGEEFRRNVPAQTTELGFDLAVTAAPKEKLPALALNAPASVNFETSQRDAKKSEPVLTKGLSDRDGNEVVAGNKFYRLPERERQSVCSSIAPGAAAVAKPNADSNGAYNLFAASDFSAGRAGESKLADKSGRSDVDVDEISSTSGRTVVNAGRLALDVPKDSFQTGLAKDDAVALRYLFTNAIATGGSAPSQTIPADSVVLEQVQRQAKPVEADKPLPHAILPAPIPQPEISTRENNFSTFSLNVSDVSFKLAAASLERGQMPDAASIRTEEFINAFDYRDPEAAAGQPLAFASERARYPFAQNRDLLRFSVKTAAAGRPAGRALNLVLLLDNSGSMERADRVAIIREALRVLATQLQPQDTVSVVTFARTARLWADGLPGDKAGETLEKVGGITPEGGTNLEEAMRLAYETARRHYLASGMNRVVLLTDGAANLGNVSATALKEKVEAQRKQGIALDCFGIGFEDFNDDLLEQLSSNGDGRYAFLNSPEDASKEFAAKLAGALQVAASDVKVQVEFNPQRVISYRQIGYAKHQLTKEQFRDNTVDAAEIAAQEAGNALYTVETKPDGTGPVATVRVRYKIPGTTDYRERSWDVAYAGNAVALAQSSPAMRLAATASAFSEWLAASPFAQEVAPDELLKNLSGVPEIYGADARPKKLEWMIRQAKSVAGK